LKNADDMDYVLFAGKDPAKFRLTPPKTRGEEEKEAWEKEIQQEQAMLVQKQAMLIQGLEKEAATRQYHRAVEIENCLNCGKPHSLHCGPMRECPEPPKPSDHFCEGNKCCGLELPDWFMQCDNGARGCAYLIFFVFYITTVCLVGTRVEYPANVGILVTILVFSCVPYCFHHIKTWYRKREAARNPETTVKATFAMPTLREVCSPYEIQLSPQGQPLFAVCVKCKTPVTKANDRFCMGCGTRFAFDV